jgi:hypothetical protein
MPRPFHETPLSTLLSWAWVAYTIEVDNAVEAFASDRVGRLFRISLAMWANGLRCLDEDGITVRELRTRARANCNIPGLERWRWLEVDSSSPDGRRRPGYGSGRGITAATVVRPTRAGRYARRVWPAAVERIEARWRTRFGAAVIDELYAAARRAADAAEDTTAPLPWAPPEVHPADGFRTHVTQADVEAPDPSDGAAQLTDVDRPLVVLLAQALTAATLRHEQDAEVSLPLGANLLRVIEPQPVSVRDLPRLGGVSKEAVAMAVGYLQRNGLAEAVPQRSIVLTPPGLDALDGYRYHVAQYDDARLRDALCAVLTQTDALITGLTPVDGCWRALPPYRAQTDRLVAGPTGALPWHPMVLHRGGWPDGS